MMYSGKLPMSDLAAARAMSMLGCNFDLSSFNHWFLRVPRIRLVFYFSLSQCNGELIVVQRPQNYRMTVA